jgi:hypothetical protein
VLPSNPCRTSIGREEGRDARWAKSFPAMRGLTIQSIVDSVEWDKLYFWKRKERKNYNSSMWRRNRKTKEKSGQDNYVNNKKKGWILM